MCAQKNGENGEEAEREREREREREFWQLRLHCNVYKGWTKVFVKFLAAKIALLCV